MSYKIQALKQNDNLYESDSVVSKLLYTEIMSSTFTKTLCPFNLRDDYGSLPNIMNFRVPVDKPFGQAKTFKSLKVNPNFRYAVSC